LNVLVSYQAGDLLALPFPDSGFDVVWYMREAGVVHASFHERMNVRAVRQLVEICNNLYPIMSQPLTDFRDPQGPLVRLRVRNEDFWCFDLLMLAWLRHR
jgi:hypothetical protein